MLGFVQEDSVNLALELLAEHLSQWAYSVAYPELALPILIQVRLERLLFLGFQGFRVSCASVNCDIGAVLLMIARLNYSIGACLRKN